METSGEATNLGDAFGEELLPRADADVGGDACAVAPDDGGLHGGEVDVEFVGVAAEQAVRHRGARF